MLRERFEGAQSYDEMLQSAEANRELWAALTRRTTIPVEALRRVEDLGDRWHLLAISEDWCGDAVNTLPVAARLAEGAANLELRVLARDQNLDVMDTHLTNGSRSIPVVIVLDEQFQEVGCWGPRPAELQHWVMNEGMQLPTEERYREVRRWYARDGGRSTLRELLDLLESAARERQSRVA